MTHEEIDARLNTFPLAVRQAWLDVGRHYGSEAVRAQASKTINAHRKYSTVVEPEGFDADQFALLVWCSEALDVALSTRISTRVVLRVTNKDRLAEMKKGKTERHGLRSALSSQLTKHRQLGTPEGDRAAQEAETALSTTASAGDSAPRLAGQLDLLATTLETAAGAPAAAKVAAARAAAQRLRAAEEKSTVTLGTPQDTQRLDLLDGLALECVRQARKAARAAARALGSPAIEKEYELNELRS